MSFLGAIILENLGLKLSGVSYSVIHHFLQSLAHTWVFI